MDKYGIDSHKAHLHPERIAQWQRASTMEEKLAVFPLYVEISPVGHCNHRCTFCAVDYIGYKPNILQGPYLFSAIKDMAEHGVKSVMFAGEGEPLLHPRLPELIKWTKQCGIDVAITTNGVMLTKDFVDECLDDISWIKVSLNAGTSESYKAIHNARDGDWYKVWTNLVYACLQKRDTVIGVQMVLLPENTSEVEVLAVDAKLAGANYLVVKPYSQHLFSTETAKRYGELKYETPEELAYNLDKFSDDTFQVITRYISMRAHDSIERGYYKCYSTPFMWAYIMATGDVYGCSAYLLDQRFRYGNIKGETFKDIWMGDRRRASITYVEETLDISECRKNCRMDKVNRYLWTVKNPEIHQNFI